jgi:hypothetical protein
MPLLDALHSYADWSGDARVALFMRRYFEFQNAQPPAVFNRSWAALRWGDNIDSIYWLYNQTGDAWLLDLVRKIHAGSADYTGGIPNGHNVNLAQGFREPAQYGLLDPDPKFTAATYRDYDTVMGMYGQFPGGGFAGDENCRPGYIDPRQGFETCGIVELMHSHQMLARMTGDPVWLDRCEDLAFNSLPAALDPGQKGVHYISCANSIALDNGTKTQGQFQNGFPMLADMLGIHYSSPPTASAVSVYWFDDTGVGECRTPQSWRPLYRDAAGTWVPVGGASGYGTALNTFNRVTFTPVTTTGLRVEVQLPPGVSGGILEWRVEGVTAPVA